MGSVQSMFWIWNWDVLLKGFFLRDFFVDKLDDHADEFKVYLVS